MSSLRTKVAGETTAAGIKADATSMVDDYRIFILVGPKVRLTIAGDAEQAAITKLRGVHDKLADLVAKAKAAGKDTTAAEQNLADMAAAITKAQNLLNGQVAAVLAIQPGPDGAAIRAKVAAVRQAVGRHPHRPEDRRRRRQEGDRVPEVRQVAGTRGQDPRSCLIGCADLGFSNSCPQVIHRLWITKGPPCTRQSSLILAAFRPWGGSRGGRRTRGSTNLTRVTGAADLGYPGARRIRLVA